MRDTIYYGISIKPSDFHSAELQKFENLETAQQWLKMEQHDFREREISSDPNLVREYKEYVWDGSMDGNFEDYDPIDFYPEQFYKPIN